MHDFAGVGPVHLFGGCNALVAAMHLGPRKDRFAEGGDRRYDMHAPTSSLIGALMLAWAWCIGFNSGSTIGISGSKWIVACRVAVTSINSACAGGTIGLLHSAIRRSKYTVDELITALLSSLVAVTGVCNVCTPAEALAIGTIGALLGIYGGKLIKKCKIDDPVGAIAVHGIVGVWGLVSVGLFADPVVAGVEMDYGIFHGGDGQLLGVQLLGAISIIAWSTITSFIIFRVIRLTIGLRMSEEDEKRGADEVEHDNKAIHRSSVFGPRPERRNPIRLRSAVWALRTAPRVIPRVRENEIERKDTTDQG